MNEVEEQLKKNLSQDLIVSVSASSNVTSTLTDMRALNAIISKYNDIQSK